MWSASGDAVHYARFRRPHRQKKKKKGRTKLRTFKKVALGEKIGPHRCKVEDDWRK
jgi:hypothetical protein